MALIVDAGPLVALADLDDPRHKAVRSFLEKSDEALFVSPFVLAEADYLLARDLGVAAELQLLADVAGGAFALEPFGPADVGKCAQIVERYRDLDIGVADASIVVLADRLRTRRVMTFDERHFRAVRSIDGDPFVLLPGDQPGRARPRRSGEAVSRWKSDI